MERACEAICNAGLWPAELSQVATNVSRRAAGVTKCYPEL